MTWQDRAREATQKFRSRMAEPQPATLTISKVTSNDDDADDEIMVRVKAGPVRVADLTIKPADFALALTGTSEAPAVLRQARSVADDRDELWARWAAVVKALGYSSAHGTTLDEEHGVLATIARLQAAASQAASETP